MGISTHILDTALGRPAAEVPVSLAHMTSNGWSQTNYAVTDADGRLKHLLPETESLVPGIYRVRFETSVYYERHRIDGLYPYVEIVFTVREGERHYHIPLLLTPNGYTTYRGS